MPPDEKTPEQLQQEMFELAQLAEPPVPAPAPEPVVTPAPALTPEPKPQGEPEATIPSWRLREEAEGRRNAENLARQLGDRVAQLEANLRREEKPPDFFENPDQAAQSLLLKTLAPFAEETRKSMMYMGRMVASQIHGADKVQEAEQAFLEARNNASLDPMDYEKVVQSPNRYDEVVKWHKRQGVLSAVGDDPGAWFDKQLEAKLADPAFLGGLLERVRGKTGAVTTDVRLPPSLSKSTAAAGNGLAALGDLSDKSLFEYATGKFERPSGA